MAGLRNDRIGEIRIMNCGMKATVIAYRGANDIDIQFEDGTIVSHTSYRVFSRGEIANPTRVLNRLGETRIMNCGLEAEIICYREYSDIDIRFSDGTIIKNKQYSAFLKGTIANPNYRIGETRIMNNGTKATIIKYRKPNDIDVRFEDGAEVKHRTYGDFKKGAIANPNNSAAKKHVGETKMMNCGMKATLTEWLAYKNITVVFENGAEVKNRNWKDFSRGSICPPRINHLGETKMMNCGMMATITEYIDYSNIAVTFEDGTVVKHKGYNNFLSGKIANPNNSATKKHIDETRMMNCGMKATITEYIDYYNIAVTFEDGTELKHKSYEHFKKGAIAHPELHFCRKTLFHGFETKLAWREDNGEVYYKCKCLNCMDNQSLMTPQEMLAHQCNKDGNF